MQREPKKIPDNLPLEIAEKITENFNCGRRFGFFERKDRLFIFAPNRGSDMMYVDLKGLFLLGFKAGFFKACEKIEQQGEIFLEQNNPYIKAREKDIWILIFQKAPGFSFGENEKDFFQQILRKIPPPVFEKISIKKTDENKGKMFCDWNDFKYIFFPDPGSADLRPWDFSPRSFFGYAMRTGTNTGEGKMQPAGYGRIRKNKNFFHIFVLSIRNMATENEPH